LPTAPGVNSRPELLQRLELHPRVDPDRLGVVVHQVAQHPLRQAQVLVQQRSGRRLEGALAHRLPGLLQVADVVGQLLVARLGGVGAQDEAAAGLGLAGLGRGLVLGLRKRRHPRRNCSRSSCEPIFCEMPMCSSCGR
jgi:hypothetical protein